MVIVPYSARQVLEELAAAAAPFQHPRLMCSVFAGVVTGARLLYAFKDHQQECIDAGLDLAKNGLDSLEGWEACLWTDDAGQAFLPYLLSEPDREPEIVVWKNGGISLRWDAVDTSYGEQPLESDFFELRELSPNIQDLRR
jgi:hypothetical protein